MKKEIKNFYSIRTLYRKRTWSYQVEKAMIMPKDYFQQRDQNVSSEDHNNGTRTAFGTHRTNGN